MPTFDHTPSVDDGIAHLRPYAVSGGRTRPTHKLDRISLVKACNSARHAPQGLVPEAVFALCQREPRSIAELSGRLKQSVQAVKVVVSDLLDDGCLIQAMPLLTADASDPYLLEQILEGLKQL
jgi:hypothetical protein